MATKIATWNINSVRLRLPIVRQFLESHSPDILCLQETKCPDGEFPAAEFRRLGYEHHAINGQKGYHGVCIVSRIPFKSKSVREFCNKGDSRHIAVTLNAKDVADSDVTLHNFYVPAGGDEPDPDTNPKFEHKLAFLKEMRDWMSKDGIAASNAIMVGDLNIAPLDTDVWNHKALLKVVSHTPIEVESLGEVMQAGPWHDAVRAHIDPKERLYSWWSYRSPDWDAADKGRRLDHIWVSKAISNRVEKVAILREARGWERPSDHVPVMATFRVPVRAR